MSKFVRHNIIFCESYAHLSHAVHDGKKLSWQVSFPQRQDILLPDYDSHRVQHRLVLAPMLATAYRLHLQLQNSLFGFTKKNSPDHTYAYIYIFVFYSTFYQVE